MAPYPLGGPIAKKACISSVKPHVLKMSPYPLGGPMSQNVRISYGKPMIFKMALIHGMPTGGPEIPRETGQLRTGQLRTAARGYNTFVRIYAYLYVFRYPILGGVPQC